MNVQLLRAPRALGESASVHLLRALSVLGKSASVHLLRALSVLSGSCQSTSYRFRKMNAPQKKHIMLRYEWYVAPHNVLEARIGPPKKTF